MTRQSCKISNSISSNKWVLCYIATDKHVKLPSNTHKLVFLDEVLSENVNTERIGNTQNNEN